MIYFDNSATTRVSEKVLEEVIICCKENFANASSLHRLGYESEKRVTQAKKDIATLINANEDEIYFTSGATESNNMAIFGICEAYKKRGKKIITTKIEHQSVLEPFKELEKRGFEVVYLDTDEKGYINIENLLNEINDETIFVSIMYVNNLVGTIQNIEEIAKKIKEKNANVIFHTDAVQAFGKIKINTKNIDLMSASGHKIHALKGIGFLYIKKGIRLEKFMYGAGQQNGIRSGTINIEGIVSLAKAGKLAYENLDKNFENAKNIRKEIIKIKDLLPDININGDEENAMPYILSISFKDIKGEVLLHALEEKDIYISVGSACNSKKRDKLNIVDKYGIGSTIRISFSSESTLEEAKIFNNAILEIAPILRMYKKR